MQTIHITYYERPHGVEDDTKDVKIGEESFDRIKEALIPDVPDHKVYLTKRFVGDENFRWHVDAAERTCEPGTVPMTYRVVLSRVHSPVEVYLDQTLKLGGNKITSLLRLGTLVEVDFGFAQKVADLDGRLAPNGQYKDMLQEGEMHKRRLAIVVKADKRRVQVIPVTSNEQSESDKSAVELSRETLDQLHFYGTSGKRSWAICSMVQTVSHSRILPPVSFYMERGERKHSRHTTYTSAVSTADKQKLRSGLLHAIGVTDYDKLVAETARLQELTSELAALRDELAAVQDERLAMRNKLENLTLAHAVAQSWAQGMGCDLDAEIKSKRDEYESCGIPILD